MNTIKLLLTFAAVALAGCANQTPQQQAAVEQTASNIAHVAVQAAGQYYGGAAGAALASDGLDGAASVMQGYVGTTIPASVLKASPGVNGVGAVLVGQFAPHHVVSQADVTKLSQAAVIAATLKPIVASPSSP